MKYNACGHYLIIELDDVPSEKRSAGGIIMQSVGDSNRREQKGMSLATVIDVGQNCWAGHYNTEGDHGSPWCAVGDKIMIAQYPGQQLPVPDDASNEDKDRLSRTLLIKDDDVLARVTDA